MDGFELSWFPVESKYEILSINNYGQLRKELVTEDPNQWGFFRLPDGKMLIVGYANLGLLPMWKSMRGCVLVGIDEVLACISISTLEERFRYTMPSVFHEFISVDNLIVVRDEIGFVGISPEGSEVWKFLVGGPISEFHIEDKVICGRQIDGDSFRFLIP